MNRRRIAAIILAAVIFSLQGCSVADTSELLSLPDPSPEHAALLSAVGSQTKQGWEFASPLTGNIRSTMYSVDVYSDGIPETVVFLRRPGELRLRMAVYAKTGSQGYKLAFYIDCPGSQFDMAEFADFNGDGRLEIILGVRAESSALMTLTVYAVENDTPRTVFDSTYTAAAVTDMTDSGNPELLLIHHGDRAYAQLCSFDTPDCTAILLGDAPLSPQVSKPDGLILGRYNEKLAGAVVEGHYTEQGSTLYISDCLAYDGDGLVNLSYSEFFGYSYTTVRYNGVSCCDINFDSYLELPIVTPEPGSTSNSADGSTLGGRYINWYRYDAYGDLSYICASYGSLSDSWYLLYPTSWRGRVYTSCSNVDGEGSLTQFIYDYQGSACVLLSVYVYPYLTDGAVASGDGSRTLISDTAGCLIYALIGQPPQQIPSEMRIRTYSEVRRSLAAVNSYGEASLATQ